MADNYDDYSKEELIRELRAKNQKPRFGLYWERDDIEHERAINTDFVALDLDESLSCGDAPFQNLIIEGDNFDALRYLRMTYKGQVKCIYIDPPYNTGNKDFVYNDRFIDKDDVYKHSKWLEFMYRRLELARDLLAEDGVIFVSIDDNEVLNLGLLMNQVFGESNRIGLFVWKSRQNKDNRTKTGASLDHEYVLCYGQKIRGDERDREQFKNPDNDIRGSWTSGNMVGLADEKARPNLHYDLIDHATGINYGRPKQGWRFDKKRMAQLIEEKRVLWSSKPTGRPRLKVFLAEMQSEFTGYSSLIGQDLYTYHGTREIDDIFGYRTFDFPKSSQFVQELVRQGASDKDSIVLDFFAGSGTTAHAVLKLNAEDGGNRRFILVSNTEATEAEPDKNLCRDVCAERVRRVMQGYTNQKAEQVEGLGVNPSTGLPSTKLRTGFAYLKTRRIASETLLTEIQHSQIWTALQLSHGVALSVFNPNSSVQQLQTADNTVMYLCQLTEQELTAVTECLEKQQTTVYSWQPALLSHYIENANLTCLPIPKFLLDRFGTGVKA
ncbi:MAG: site-specific DNA-methyltransferase [Methylococcales bacterium]|nr:site-specific DNA-methyltransferase [Methylococcales bacterium]